MTNTRRYIAAALLSTLLIPFQNCGEKTDLAGYGKNNASSTAPSVPEIADITPDSTVALFDSVALGVVAKGDEPLTYEWKKDGVVISGQTKQIMNTGELAGAAPTNPPAPSTLVVYTVTVTDKDGESITKDIRITVAPSTAQLALPTIAAPGLVDTTPIPACNTGVAHANRQLKATVSGYKTRVTWVHQYASGGQTITDPSGVGTDGVAIANYIRFFNANGQQVAKCIAEGTYIATVTDYFGRTATAQFNLNY